MSEQDEQVGSIAVIGMAGRFPGARTVDALWENLRQGVEARTVFTDEQLEAAGVERALRERAEYVRAGFVLDEPELFDASFFGIPPREAEVLDPQHRLFLESAWEALENAGYVPDTFPGRIAVFAGVGLNHYLMEHLLPRPDVMRSVGGYALSLANDKDFMPSRVSHKLDLRGPSMSVQTACSSSLVAVHQACQSLLALESDIALAGGVSISLPQHRGYLHEEGGIDSRDGHCRAFDAQSSGTVAGSGVGIVVLKRLEDALKDGDFIHAVIRGSAINNDGSDKVGYTAPSVNGQASVITEALSVAGVTPETIQYVEAHGTGTSLGDPIEVAALNQAFGGTGRPAGSCALGSLKTNIGHLDTASGVSGLIKTVLSLRHRWLPPSLHFTSPNPRIDFAGGPFAVNTTSREWPASTTPRRAGVSSFGIGGTNAHVVLEEAPAREKKARAAPSPWRLLVLSARTAPALEDATRRLAAHLAAHPDAELADVAYTLHAGRQRFEHRRVVVGRDAAELREALETKDSRRCFTREEESTERPVAFLLPGQGTQHVDMARELYESEPVFREHLDTCFKHLAPHLGLEPRSLLYPAPEAAQEAARRLERTEFAQPALFSIGYALARLWMSWGVRPQAMLGHSLGEYVAACLAGVMSLEDALALVAARGKMMQALPGSAMLSVHLDEAELSPLLGERLSIAALNGPGLSVASGPEDAIAALEATLKARGVEHRRLHTSHAFHSAVMDPILAPFEARVRAIPLSPPKIPYVSNLTGTWVTAAQATDPRYWAEHLRRPVRFAQGVATLLEDSRRVLLEVGPGQTLGRLARRGAAAGGILLASLPEPREQQSAAAMMRATAGRLWLAGARLEAAKLHGSKRRVPLPTYPFQRERYWVERLPREDVGATASAPARKLPEVGDWIYVPGWKSAPLASRRATSGTRCLLLMDAGGVGERLARALESAGDEVVRVIPSADFARKEPRHYGLDPREPSHYARLLGELKERGELPGRILHLWSMTASATEAMDRGFYSLTFLSRALQEHPSREPVELTLVTSGTQDVTGEEALSPTAAMVLGPCRVIPQEGYPRLSCRLVDVTPPHADSAREARLVEQLVEELRSGSREPVVALRGPRRWVEHFEAVRVPASEGLGALRERGVYLITGGLGRIGLAVAEHLATVARARLVLVGRTPAPARERWEEVAGQGQELARRLLALEQRGAEVLTLQADVAEPEQLRRVLALARERFGALHGVVHGAGSVGRETRIPLHQAERGACEAGLHAKVRGLLALEEALRGEALDFVVSQSSLSTVLGGLGFATYAAANAFMDAFAIERARHAGPRWLSIDWDGWYDGQGTPEPLAMMPAEGVEVLHRLLAGGATGRRIVSTAPLASRRDRALPDASAPAAREPASGGHQRPALETEYVAPRDATEQRLAEIWQELFGIERVGVHDDFFELGGHSLLATQVLSRVHAALEVELPVGALFETPTIAGLALAIVQQRAALVDESTLEALLAEIE